MCTYTQVYVCVCVACSCPKKCAINDLVRLHDVQEVDVDALWIVNKTH